MIVGMGVEVATVGEAGMVGEVEDMGAGTGGVEEGMAGEGAEEAVVDMVRGGSGFEYGRKMMGILQRSKRGVWGRYVVYSVADANLFDSPKSSTASSPGST